MEGCPRLPTLGFDLKLAIESVNLCEKIPQFISSNYQENSQDYVNECDQINRLRQNALQVSIDQSTAQYLKRYYCQLLLLRNRFPMFSEGECSVRFTWEDAFQKEENTYNDIRFEEACILYNLAAIYSKLGANESRKTHESMKNACTYFRCSAACLERIRDQYTIYAIDFTPDLLTCQVDILMGQAHEAVLEKSFLDRRPPSVNAHVAMQISEYYQKALANLLKSDVESIVSRRFREWRVALIYKSSYYLALTYFCCAQIADENKKRGEAACYYENALETLKEAWKNATKISNDKSSVYKDGHTFTLELFQEKHKIAKRDNDNVYFEKVPSLSSLPVIQGAVVAKPQMFDYQDSNISGTDIFQRLIPMDAHLAVSEYSEEKAKLLREVLELVDEKNRELESFMACLQTDKMPLNNEYLRLSRELLDCCAAASTRPHISKDLVSAMQQLNSQHHDVIEQINECEQLLETLQSFTDESKEIKSQLQNMGQMMLQAHESNLELHRHMTKMIEHFKLLHSPFDQLEQTLPVITELEDETIKPKLARLGLLYEKIDTMKKQRETLLKEFRRKLHDDDITKLVLMQRQDNFKSLFASQIKKHEELINIIKQNCRAQDNICQSITEANADIADIRPKMISKFESRQRLIEDCIKSLQVFDETLSKASEGIEFYKKQTEKLKMLQERVVKLQLKQQNKPVHQPVSPPHPPMEVPRIPDRPRLKDYLPIMKPETWGSVAFTNSEESIYIPPSLSAVNSQSDIYAQNGAPQYMTHMPGHMLTSMANYNLPSYPVQPAMYAEASSMPLMPPTSGYSVSNQMPYQQMNYMPSNGNEQRLTNPPPMPYASSFYSNPQFYSMPPSMAPAQAMPYPAQTNYPTNFSNPSIYSNNDLRHSIPQSVPPVKFDPYRPQPVGAYDIPKVTAPTTLLNPQDVYHPGGLLGLQTGMMNHPPYEQNQYVPTASFANLSLNPMLNH